MRKVVGLLLLVALLLAGLPVESQVWSGQVAGRAQSAGHGGGELL